MNRVVTAFYKDIFAVIFDFIELEVSCVLDFNSELDLFALQLNSEISEMQKENKIFPVHNVSGSFYCRDMYM